MSRPSYRWEEWDIWRLIVWIVAGSPMKALDCADCSTRSESLTSARSLPANIRENSCSVHAASCSEIVACHLYKKLNSIETTLPSPWGENSRSIWRMVCSLTISQKISARNLKTYLQRVKSPSVPVSDQTKNGTDVITQDNLHEECTIYEPRAMEYFIILS